MLYPISECFFSLQWEGYNTWKPSIFVRFWWCNLKCWYCDTPYAVTDASEMKMMKLEEITDQIKSYPCEHIVFTWWEPAMFEDQINMIMSQLPLHYTTEIETNGAFKLNNKYDQVNVSYKTSNSWNKRYELKALDSTYDYKFVVENEEDLKEIEEIIEKYELFDNRIYLMPLWVTKESQVNEVVMKYCLDHGYLYCQRIHILLFWNKRWV